MKKKQEPAVGPRRRPGRTEQSKEKILKATIEILYESGMGFSIEEVARRSGVAKTTIYRLWPSRIRMVLEAGFRFTPEPRRHDTGIFAADMRGFIQDLAAALESARWTGILPMIVDAAERDGEIAGILQAIQLGHAAPIREMVQKAQKRGELNSKVDPAFVAASIMGPLFYRRWFSRQPLDKPFVERLIMQVSSFSKSGTETE